MVFLEQKQKSTYTGLERAAILLLSVSEEQTQKIFSLLTPEEIKELSQTMINLGVITSDTVEQLCIDFVNEIASSGSLVGSFESTERLLRSILPKETAQQIIDEIRGPMGRNIWDKLSNVNEEILANYLKNEQPQTIAVVLSRIRPETAAIILSNLPQALADDVVIRILRMEPVRKEIIDSVEEILRKEFIHNLTRTTKNDTYQTVAEIFNNLDRSSETRLLGGLDSNNHDAAEKVRSMMFTFEDVSELDNQNLQILMKNVDKSKLAMALKGVPERVKAKFAKNLSERASKLLLDEMANMGPVRIKDVEIAQNEIVTITKEMAARNEITLASSNDFGDQFVE